MGAAGDMLMAALYELLNDAEKKTFLDTMNRLFPGDVIVAPTAAQSCGIGGTHMQVEVLHTQESTDVGAGAGAGAGAGIAEGAPNPESGAGHAHGTDPGAGHAHHSHYTYPSILAQIDRLPLSDSVKKDAASIYQLIGEAEATVHGCALSQIHFHEVGSLDAIADVVGCSLLFSMLQPDAVLASPIHVGNGTVRCAHGILPVPAPATAEILKGIPYYTGEIATELCTPTGAAVLKHFASDFISMPVMNVSRIGIGLGTKEFAQANCVRVFWGERASADPAKSAAQTDAADSAAFSRPLGCDSDSDKILELSCNLDDISGEELGYAMEKLFEAGAYEVFYESVYMKKNRPGILLRCFCASSEKERFTKLIFEHTTTRGLRYQYFSRAKMNTHFEEISTPYGPVRRKVNEAYGICKSKYEYEDLRRIANEQGLSIAKVKNRLS
jgi:uncharacterized protein (TIGR00299 family) protein